MEGGTAARCLSHPRGSCGILGSARKATDTAEQMKIGAKDGKSVGLDFRLLGLSLGNALLDELPNS
jgi:hypothetical protein